MNDPAHSNSRFMTARELQARWGISAQTFYRLQKSGKITARRPFGNRTTRFDLAEVLRLEETGGLIRFETGKITGRKKAAKRSEIPTTEEILRIPSAMYPIALLKDRLEDELDIMEAFKGKPLSFEEVLCADRLDEIKFAIYILWKESLAIKARTPKGKQHWDAMFQSAYPNSASKTELAELQNNLP